MLRENELARQDWQPPRKKKYISISAYGLLAKTTKLRLISPKLPRNSMLAWARGWLVLRLNSKQRLLSKRFSSVLTQLLNSYFRKSYNCGFSSLSNDCINQRGSIHIRLVRIKWNSIYWRWLDSSIPDSFVFHKAKDKDVSSCSSWFHCVSSSTDRGRSPLV